MHPSTRHALATIATLLPFAILPASAGTTALSADQPALTTTEVSSDWDFRLAIYGWAQAMEGDLMVKGKSTSVDLNFSDIAEDLQFAAMGAFEISHGRWGFMADFNYAEISDAMAIKATTVKFEQDQFLGDFVLSYDLLETGSSRLDVYAGARVNSIDASLRFDFPKGGTLEASDSATWTDPIIGGRFQQELSDSFFFRAVGDLGGFGAASDLTWQAMAGFGYRIPWSGSLLLGYRAIGTDYTDGGFTYDVTAHGPIIGAEFQF